MIKMLYMKTYALQLVHIIHILINGNDTKKHMGTKIIVQPFDPCDRQKCNVSMHKSYFKHFPHLKCNFHKITVFFFFIKELITIFIQ